MKSKAILVLLTLLSTPLQVLSGPPPIYYCSVALEGDPLLQPIRDKVVLSGMSDPTFSMMGDESYPASLERAAIYEWGKKRERCVTDNPPQASPILQAGREGFNSVQALILDLYKGTITYGQFNIQRQEIDGRATGRMKEIIGQQQQQQYQQQQQQQQQYQKQQRQQQQPVTTRCRWDILSQETVCETR